MCFCFRYCKACTVKTLCLLLARIDNNMEFKSWKEPVDEILIPNAAVQAGAIIVLKSVPRIAFLLETTFLKEDK